MGNNFECFCCCCQITCCPSKLGSERTYLLQNDEKITKNATGTTTVPDNLDTENLQNLVAERLLLQQKQQALTDINDQNNTNRDIQNATSDSIQKQRTSSINSNPNPMEQQPMLVSNANDNVSAPPNLQPSLKNNAMQNPPISHSQNVSTSSKKRFKEVFSDGGGDETVTDEDEILSATDRDEEAYNSTAVVGSYNKKPVAMIGNTNETTTTRLSNKFDMPLKSATSGDEITSDEESGVNAAKLMRATTKDAWSDDKLERLESEMRQQFLLLQTMTQQQQQQQQQDDLTDVGNNTDLNTDNTSADEVEQMKKQLTALQNQQNDYS